MATERTSRRGMARILPALAILALAAGCGHDESTAASPKSSEIGLLKQAAAASSVVSETVQISSDAIVDDVRAVRESIDEEFGHDVEKIAEQARKAGEAFRRKQSSESRPQPGPPDASEQDR